MLSTLGIVEARLSAGLKGKIARKLGGKSVLEWIVRQVTDSARLDSVVVISCDAESDRHLSQLAPPDVAFVASEGRDVLSTYAAVLAERPAKAVVRVFADTPFVDPVLIDCLVRTADDHPTCDYIGYALDSGQVAAASPLGILAEWCRAEVLLQADRETDSPEDRQHPTRFVYSRPEQFSVLRVPTPAGLDRKDLRLTIVSEEDWENTQAIYEALGPERMDWRRVADLLDNHPALRRRMAVLNQDGN